MIWELMKKVPMWDVREAMYPEKMTTEQLSEALDEIAEAFDPYEYRDNVEIGENTVQEVMLDLQSGNGGIISQLKMQNEMKLTDESWISYQQGKGNEEYQKYMEDLTGMQNHVLPYLQSFCSLEEKGVQERREQKIAEKNESREAVPRTGVEANTAVKDAGKAERKTVEQKKAMARKEKKPSIHERLEINKRIIQEKQGKDKPERGADLGVRTV